MLYWLAPRLWKGDYNKRLANWHFWLGTLGILVYIIAMYTAGVTQGLMWRAFDETGKLMYPDFMETVIQLMPMYWLRVVGGTMYLTGTCIGAYNMWQAARGGAHPDTVAHVAKPTWRNEGKTDGSVEKPKTYDEAFAKLDKHTSGGLHRALEGWPMLFTALTTIAILIGGAVEIIPMILVKSNVPRIATVTPYTALELEGRDIYIREGCYNCHSQMIRPMLHETERYGEYSKPGEFIYDHPFQWGSKRTGPDLHRVGGKYPHLWHVRHMQDPRSTTPTSIMPPYAFLLEDELDLSNTQSKIETSMMLGVPYTPAMAASAVEDAQKQAAEIAAQVEKDGGPTGLANKEIIALVAYLQRLGVDIKKEAK
jgi:cytochrome c oxidase cbb3-type subunit I/II